MTTPEQPSGKLTFEEVEKLMEALRSAHLEEEKKHNLEVLGKEVDEEGERVRKETQRINGHYFGRDRFSPIQIEELSTHFRIDDEYIRNMPIDDAELLDMAFEGEYSDTLERLGKTPFEAEEDAENSLKGIHERLREAGDERF